MSNKIVVLSNTGQQAAFNRSFSMDGWTVWSDNAQFLEFKILDEFLLRGRWNEVNAWGCAKAAGYCRLTKEHSLFEDLDWASVIYLFFSLILTQMLKNYLYAEYLVSENPDQIAVFHVSELRKYPDFSGNAYLNYFLQQAAEAKGIPVSVILIDEKLDAYNEFPSSGSWLKRRFSNFSKRAAGRLLKRLAPAAGTIDVLASGSLRHLAGTVNELKRRNITTALFDHEFHAEQFIFALRNARAAPACAS